MIRHVLLLTLRPDASPAELGAIADGFDRLAREIAEIRGMRHGKALQLPGSSALPADYAVMIDFDDPDAFARYIDHPLHRAFVRSVLQGVRTGGMSAQISI